MTEISLELVEKLAAAITELGLVITADQQQQLLQYLSLLYKWNKAYNLSGLQKLDEMLVLHVIDSLAVLPFFTANTIADIGTGAGLPGMVLAICKPEAELFLIDSNSKKNPIPVPGCDSTGFAQYACCACPSRRLCNTCASCYRHQPSLCLFAQFH